MEKDILQIEMYNLLKFAEKIVAFISMAKEETQTQYTKLYWTDVKISNNRDIFKDIDKEVIEQLCKEVKTLLDFQDKLLKVAANMQKKVETVAEELKGVDGKDRNQFTKIYTQLKNINAEIDILWVLYESYKREQNAFGKAANDMVRLLKEKLPIKERTISENFRGMIKRFVLRGR